MVNDLNGEPILFIYESIKLNETSDFSSIKFLKGYSLVNFKFYNLKKIALILKLYNELLR